MRGRALGLGGGGPSGDLGASAAGPVGGVEAGLGGLALGVCLQPVRWVEEELALWVDPQEEHRSGIWLPRCWARWNSPLLFFSYRPREWSELIDSR